MIVSIYKANPHHIYPYYLVYQDMLYGKYSGGSDLVTFQTSPFKFDALHREESKCIGEIEIEDFKLSTVRRAFEEEFPEECI